MKTTNITNQSKCIWNSKFIHKRKSILTVEFKKQSEYNFKKITPIIVIFNSILLIVLALICK